jgi:hypothetical protein
MTALPESPAARPDCSAVVADFARALPGLETESLRAVLRLVQLRLGTAAEQPCDVERSQLLAHEISNRLTAEKMRRGLARLDPPTP